jgi:hypothetical protein
MAVISPREFCEAMRDLVARSQRNPATAVSDQAYQMKLRILDHFVERGPDAASFEDALRARIADPDPQKDLSRGVCCQILNSWRAGSCRYTPERQLVLPALYPADEPATIEEEGDDDDE